MPLALYWLLNEAANGLHRDALRSQAVTISGFLKPRGQRRGARHPARDGTALCRQLRALRLCRAQLRGPCPVLLAQRRQRAVPAQGAAHRRLGDAPAHHGLGAVRRQRVAHRRRPHLSDPGGAGPGASRRHHRRHRRLVLPQRRLDHLPAAAGAAPDRHPDLPPCAQAGARGLDHGGHHRPDQHRGAPAGGGDADRDRAAGSRRQPGARSPREGLPCPARVHRRHGARAAHAAHRHPRPRRFAGARPVARCSCARTSRT